MYLIFFSLKFSFIRISNGFVFFLCYIISCWINLPITSYSNWYKMNFERLSRLWRCKIFNQRSRQFNKDMLETRCDIFSPLSLWLIISGWAYQGFLLKSWHKEPPKQLTIVELLFFWDKRLLEITYNLLFLGKNTTWDFSSVQTSRS